MQDAMFALELWQPKRSCSTAFAGPLSLHCGHHNQGQSTSRLSPFPQRLKYQSLRGTVGRLHMVVLAQPQLVGENPVMGMDS
jgi:hypothetical protein